MTKFSAADLENRYQDLTNSAKVTIRFTTDYYGGQPADDKGLKAFVEHHLGLEGQAADEAVSRIKKEELGEKDTTPEGGEIIEKQVYGVNRVRRDDEGPWIGNWQIKACIKAAASRLGIFMKKRGSKGDLSEMTRVVPIGESKKTEHPDRIHFYAFKPGAGSEINTEYREVLGSVGTPQGKKSISCHTEIVPRGTMASFEMRYPGAKLSDDSILDIFSAIGNIGLGSARSFENGLFRVEELEIDS
jgi:hypothetical protein